MVSDIAAVCGLCLAGAALCKVMERYQKEYGLFLALTISCGALTLVILSISPILIEIQDMFQRAGVGFSQSKVLFQALGVCYVTQSACDLCRDQGEGAIAAQMELVGKITLLLLGLPLYKSLLDVAGKFLN